MSNEIRRAEAIRRALEMFVETLTDDDDRLEIADIYPEYRVRVAYKPGQVIRWGEDDSGDARLYSVLQAHTSAAEWPPDTAVSLYKRIGITLGGVLIWVQPLGATDAYQIGDVVMHGGKQWESTTAGNVWEPGVYGWKEKAAQ
ncbi:MAG: hypothetical protein RSG50_01530 [Clostridia bacterium]